MTDQKKYCKIYINNKKGEEEIENRYLIPREAFILYGRLSLHQKSPALFWRATAKLTQNEKLSMRAVSECISTLKVLGEHESVSALYETYFSIGKAERKNAPITSAIKQFAQNNFMDERTVYRRLQKASKIYISITNKFAFSKAA